MKKIYLGLLFSAALLSSCDMDTVNYGKIDQGNAIESAADCESFTNGLFIRMRSVSGGNYIAFGDIQMDQFVGTVDNGNRVGPFSTGQIMASDTDLPDMYSYLYGTINNANYLIEKAEPLLEDENISDADKATIKYGLGVAHFARAYSYWWLFDKFVWYKTDDLTAEGKGLQIVDKYDPSADRGTYVGRSSIEKTVAKINEEAKAAYEIFKDYEANVSDRYVTPEATRLSSYTVEALQARMAVLTGNWGEALSKAEDVITSGVYPLVDTDGYADLWLNDSGSELLWVPYAVQGQGGIGTGSIYYANNQKNSSDYIPTANVLASYPNGDVRFDAFFELYQPMTIGGNDYYAFAFNKYPGNPALNTGTTNSMLNKAKPFRTSELYLIAAEAAYHNNDATKANKYLNDLREKRIEGWKRANYSGAQLLQNIKDERGRELIGEGLRLSDLRRWGEGFIRTGNFSVLGFPFDAVSAGITPNTDNVQYRPDSYLFIWPIPFREMQVNPQLKGQQNPGY